MASSLDITKNKEQASALPIDITMDKKEEQSTQEEVSSFKIILEYTKLAFPATITRACLQVSFVFHFVAKEFDDTKKWQQSD